MITVDVTIRNFDDKPEGWEYCVSIGGYSQYGVRKSYLAAAKRAQVVIKEMKVMLRREKADGAKR